MGTFGGNGGEVMSATGSPATRRVSAGVRRASRLPPALRRLQPLTVGRGIGAGVIVLSFAILAWAVAAAGLPGIRYITLGPRVDASIEAASALLRLFAALVLFLLPAGRAGQ